jgi:hypothetical protein
VNYTGPVPPAPTGASTDAQWQTWWAYQGVLRDLRYEDERVATAARDARIRTEDMARNQRLDDERAAAVKLAAERAVIVDRQHTERMAAEAACAAGQQALAAAMRYAADRSREPEPVPLWTDEQLVRQFMFNMADTVTQGTAAMGRAQAYLLALRAVYKPAPAPVQLPAPSPAKDAP